MKCFLYINQISPGLGESELFYSWVIALFNIGALFGAVGTGFLIKYIPYWHLILLTLILHTVGYVLYAISYEGWVIMLSKFLSGIFIGGEMTLALSYFAESSAEYKNIWQQMGEKRDESIIRRKLFAWHNIGVGIGYILGPGMLYSMIICVICEVTRMLLHGSLKCQIPHNAVYYAAISPE